LGAWQIFKERFNSPQSLTDWQAYFMMAVVEKPFATEVTEYTEKNLG